MKYQKNETVKKFEEMQNADLNIHDPFDKAVIIDFENELKAKYNRTIQIGNNILSWFSLYLHENNLFVYSKKYPNGSVIMSNLEAYRYARKKKKGLDELLYAREAAIRHEKEAAMPI